jgi:hypothetical protein
MQNENNRIKVMAIDVGVATGVAIAEIYPKGVVSHVSNLPVIEKTILMPDCDFVPSYAVIQLREVFKKHPGIKIVIVEWPFHPANYTPSADFTHMVGTWKEQLGETFEGVPVRTVRPTDWKGSPSKKVTGVLKTLPQESNGRVSKHEQDAVRIIHWAGNFSNFPEFARK